MHWVPALLLSLGAASAARGQQAPRPRTAPPARRAAPAALTPVEQRIRAVETGLLPSIRIKGRIPRDLTLAARMKQHGVTGVSIAVINEYGIEWARAYGTDGARVPLDTATPLPAGAAGEPVVAAVALALVRGKKLDLERDVNRSLRKWKIPKSDYTKTRPVTLAALLAHGGGLSRLPSPVPALDQVLDGVRMEQFPTLEYRPDGADYAVVEQLVADVTRKPFADAAAETVLRPLGMTRSAFGPPLAAQGLRSTPADLARFALDVQRAAAGKPSAVITADLATRMLTPAQYAVAGAGLVPVGRDSALRFEQRGRVGDAESEIVAFVRLGRGAVVITTGGPGSGQLVAEILNAIGKTYAWPEYVPPEKVVARVDPRVYDRYIGTYVAGERSTAVTRRGTRLFLGSARGAPELLPESVSDFFTTAGDAMYSFVFDENGKVGAMTVKRRDGDERWDRRIDGPDGR